VSALDDLVAFARIEVESGDLEPWAALLATLHADTLDVEQALWAVKLYNAFDDFGSAWNVFDRWPGPYTWRSAADRATAAAWPCTQERRGLRGGRVIRHLDSYTDHLGGDPQSAFVRVVLRGDPEADFARLQPYLRRVWGVGRQTAFEWAEFLGKVTDLPVTAGHAFLWESEGPRRSLQRLYGCDRPTPGWLDDRAVECREMLAAAGVVLAWEDLETVLCDFNVMRDGRYYVGKHLASLRAEIDTIANRAARDVVLDAWWRTIPMPWAAVAPGIDRDALIRYRDEGRL
jgi:Alpha-glutamyl/putrescinyl thymine pyrophosphorylase clade 2